MRVELEIELGHETNAGNWVEDRVRVWGEFKVNPSDSFDLLEGEYGADPVPWCWLSAENQQTAKEELWAEFWFRHGAMERAHALDNPPPRRADAASPSPVRPELRLIQGGLSEIRSALKYENHAVDQGYRPTWTGALVARAFEEARRLNAEAKESDAKARAALTDGVAHGD